MPIPTKHTVSVNATKRKWSDNEDHVIFKKKTNVPASVSSVEMNASKWRQEHSITVHGLSSSQTSSYVCPDPMLHFCDTPFSKEFQDCLTRAGFTAPTPTQSQSWPIALAKQDMISVAKTGSGKTVGFLLPSFHHLSSAILAAKARVHPRILILAPTRELATQIEAEAKKFNRAKPHIRTGCVYGGAPKYPQIRQLEIGVDCLVATPGRLNDFVTTGKVNLSFVEILVLDEADRMLDMGFEPQIRSIVDVLPAGERRQTLLFSATWPKSIQKLAHALLRNHPVQVNMGSIDRLQANQDICQTVDICDESEKPQKLIDLMDAIVKEYNPYDDIHISITAEDAIPTSRAAGRTSSAVNTDVTQHVKTIVFFRTKRSCDQLAQEYWQHGYAVGALHGDKDQHERTRTMNQFKQGTIKLLFATDVAARGLDVKDVGIVINYDMPGGTNGIEDYVHRIGRTGRAGVKGRSFSFFTAADVSSAKELVNILQSAKQDVPASLLTLVNQKRHYNSSKSASRGRQHRFGRGRR